MVGQIPAGWIGLLLSAFSVTADDVNIGPEATRTLPPANRFYAELAQTGRFLSPDGDWSIEVRGIRGSRLFGTTLNWLQSGTVIKAKEAVIRRDSTADQLLFHLKDGKAEMRNGIRWWFEDRILEVPLGTLKAWFTENK